MTDGIGRIFGGNSYNLNGFVPQKKEETPVDPEPVVTRNEEDLLDPQKVMDFLNANSVFIGATENKTAVGELSPDVKERITAFMENYQVIMDVIADEFGEELAPVVMDIAMDYLMDLAA
jgi:hypothetical protein